MKKALLLVIFVLLSIGSQTQTHASPVFIERPLFRDPLEGTPVGRDGWTVLKVFSLAESGRVETTYYLLAEHGQIVGGIQDREAFYAFANQYVTGLQ